MIKLATVNKELEKRGINAKLTKGGVRPNSTIGSYFYFYGPDVYHGYSTSISVPRINSLTLEQWIKEAQIILRDSHDRRTEISEGRERLSLR